MAGCTGAATTERVAPLFLLGRPLGLVEIMMMFCCLLYFKDLQELIYKGNDDGNNDAEIYPDFEKCDPKVSANKMRD
jgi:hypothetical protein